MVHYGQTALILEQRQTVLDVAYRVHLERLYRDQRYCLDVCPVDCMYPVKGRTYDDGRPTFDEVPQLYIDPTECVDCGACVPVCPVTAIFAEADLPEKWHNYIEVNVSYVVGGKFQPDKYQKASS
jgi:ferredoxin